MVRRRPRGTIASSDGRRRGGQLLRRAATGGRKAQGSEPGGRVMRNRLVVASFALLPTHGMSAGGRRTRAGCGAGGSAGAGSHPRGRPRDSCRGQGTLNPAVNTQRRHAAGRWAALQRAGGDRRERQPVPELAERLGHQRRRAHYEFTVRQGVKFHEGRATEPSPMRDSRASGVSLPGPRHAVGSPAI